MRDIATRYGLKINRSGFCNCPFHTGDRTASLKLYKDSFHCFACGANGDIFTFIQKMDSCDFKTAFYSLGGEYAKEDRHKSQLARYHAEKARIKREKEEQKRKRQQFLINVDIHAYRELMQSVEEGSEDWWDYARGYYLACERDENLQGGEY